MDEDETNIANLNAINNQLEEFQEMLSDAEGKVGSASNAINQIVDSVKTNQTKLQEKLANTFVPDLNKLNDEYNPRRSGALMKKVNAKL